MTGWGGLATDGARQAAQLPAKPIGWPPPVDASAPATERMLTVLAAAPAGVLLGRRIAVLANVAPKQARRRLGRLAAEGRIVATSNAQSVLNRTWRLP